MIKALTLWQPWASLAELREKKLETRSWATSYRGPLLIHSAVSMPRVAKEFCPEVARLLGVESYNGSMWYYMQHHGGSYYSFGHILAICNLVNCLNIVSFNSKCAYLEDDTCIEGNEFAFGDYTLGRYAWKLEDIYRLKTPIKAKGRQSLWNFDETEKLIAIDPWVIGDTKIWTPQGIRKGQQVSHGTEDAVYGLEVA